MGAGAAALHPLPHHIQVEIRIGLIGCGAQAVTQFHALSQCFDLKEVHYFDTDAMALSSS